MKITEAQQRTIDNRNNWGTISKNIQKDIERIEDIRKDLAHYLFFASFAAFPSFSSIAITFFKNRIMV